jgi:hypothetical protein
MGLEHVKSVVKVINILHKKNVGIVIVNVV